MYIREETIGFQIRTLSNLFRRQRELERANDPENISGIQAWTIGFLFDNQDRAIFQKDIEKEFNIRRSTVTALLQSMEKKNYIIRKSVSDDKRLKQILLTDKGLNLHLRFLSSIEHTEDAVRNDISDEELKIFFNCIKKMQDNLSNLQKGDNNEENQVD